MVTEQLQTTKVTELTLILTRKLSKRTGEKQYRILERLVSAEYERTATKPKGKK